MSKKHFLSKKHPCWDVGQLFTSLVELSHISQKV